ncbi:amidase [Rhabdobacter roseus]|uniref:Amidase n=1 Tax=Rhabdobacter roseus TaxID=1655419 RepID=A0A840TUS4_9BACT|nr:amidase [Rhabdobacter roseus]MBB5286994.1 amidase [Rhabdobacter roseus]
MTPEEYQSYDATALTRLVANGDISPGEPLEIAISLTEKYNPKLNAVVQSHYYTGREAALHLPEGGALRGVPFLVKDLSLEWAGTRLTEGSRGLAAHISERDSHYIERCKKAGLVLFGKTNTSEFGLTPYTESELYGPARNPWNLAHSPGGSSGGGAAAVAAGIVPAASASDGGGSIRIPASCCGLFGMKPSRGRISLGPAFGQSWGDAVVEGALTRSVRDSAALLDILQGYEPGDPYRIQSHELPYTEEVTRPPGRLRIAFCTRHTYPAQTVDAECVRAVEDTARLLESLGHDVAEVPLPYGPEVFKESYFPMIVSETAATLRLMEEALGRAVKPDDVEPNTWLLARLGETVTGAEYAHALLLWNRLSRDMAAFHQRHDVFLTPVMAWPPVKIGELQNSRLEDFALKLLQITGGYGFLKNSSLADELIERSASYIPYTPIANLTGQPAMSVPLHWTETGLPVGVMFTGRLNEEGLLFRLAAQLETARPWFSKRPSVR